MKLSVINRIAVIAVSCIFLVSASDKNLKQLQNEYVDLRFGMFIHFGIETFNMGDYWNNSTPPDISKFKLATLDCKNWADAAKAAGMKYGVLTTKHHYGFCMWNTATTTYNCMNAGTLKTDVVKAYCEAFRADSLKPGLYYSMFDAHDTVDGSYNSYSRTLWDKKKAYIKAQITELLTNYGDIPILIVDGWAWKMGHNIIPYQEIRELVKSLQPNCLLCDHDGVSKPWDNDIVMFEEPKGVYCPSINTYAATQGQIIVTQSSGSWFWTGGGTIMTSSSITTHLKNLEPRYCNFLLNCPPDTDGKLNQAIIDTLAKVGQSWSKNTARDSLPEQPQAIEHPVTPVAAIDGTGANAWNAIDGYNDVFSATNVGQSLWSGSTPPQYITIDLGVKYYNLEILGYLPRQDYNSTKRVIVGNITRYTISISDDNSAFTPLTSGVWTADSTYKIAEWSTPASGRYIRLQADSAKGGSSVVISEISLGGRSLTPSTTETRIIVNAAASVNNNEKAETFTALNGIFKATPGKIVYIYDMAGRKIKSMTIDNNTSLWNLPGIAGKINNLYIFKVSDKKIKN
ncbi:MAG TPA: alpha-L-fucosidase [Fibrobacteres bacterium]|jgi:alpha-L-fucosidase|nr:alpha-L-fucosidase [Fibrobacterota bacterium]